MKHTLLQEKYPVFTLEVEKQETDFGTLDEIVDYLKTCIESHRVSRFIATFDHYAHTKGLEEGQVDELILGAMSIVFCFGITLPCPQAMAVRPRSIGVVELADSFVITFMEAPMPVANSAMEMWARSIRKPKETGAEIPARNPKAPGNNPLPLSRMNHSG